MPAYQPAQPVTFYVTEGNTAVIAASFVDETGASAIVSNRMWQILDGAANILGSGSAIGSGSALTIVVGSALTQRQVFDDLQRILKITGTYNSTNGSGLTMAQVYRFGISPLHPDIIPPVVEP